MARFLGKLVACVLLIACAVTSIAQQAAPISRQEAAVRAKVARLSPQAPISVLPLRDKEEFGTFVSSNDTGFTFFDIDRKNDVTLQYAEVRKIKDGYGGYNAVQHRHTDRAKGLILLAVAIGILGGVIGAVAAAKN